MATRTNQYGMMYPLGVTVTENGAEILVRSEAEAMSLVLYRAGESEILEKIAFDAKDRIGDIWRMSLDGYDFSELEYGFEADGEWMADPCAKSIVGREIWGGAMSATAAEGGEGQTVEGAAAQAMTVPGTESDCKAQPAERKVRARVKNVDFAWDDDKRPEIPYSESIIYRLHVRGFTKHESSHVRDRNKGTFAGLIQMIPYLKELGVTAVELMPITEFDEVMVEEVSGKIPGTKVEKKPNGKLNYWGYGPSFQYALKSSYGTGVMPIEMEFKILMKELHRSEMECILEMFFTGDETPSEVLNVLRYWVEEYHVDGFKIAGDAPLELIAADPFLKGTKLFADDWDAVLAKKNSKKSGTFGGANMPKNGPVTVREKHLAEYNAKFQNEMRQVLRGDQGKVQSLMEWTLKNPEDHAIINYMANTNGFTMMDMVSYDEKHNEANGEKNQDGTDQNWSWNCGEEGPTEKERIINLRKQQICNAFMLLLLSQGTPLIMAGDEFGNSQNGNNNAYCQDNEIGWIDWNLLEENFEIFQFVKEVIAFRKAHKAFHMDYAAKKTDYRSLGCPDVSCHGQSAWKPETDYFRKQLGIMYWGAYEKKADGTPDDTYYVAYNMHWGTHRLGLPRLPRGQRWKVAFDTSGGGAAVKERIRAQIPPYSVVVFVAISETGYWTYETPIGELTLVCQNGVLTELMFGRAVPEHAEEIGLQEEKLATLDMAYKQLQEYFAGERKEFDIPMHAEGTEFQMKVWDALKTIPYGETRSYKEIAAQIGNEKASQAVAIANSRNLLPIFIPCHRVIGAGGGIAGYAGGAEIKAQLLELEKKYYTGSAE